MHMQGLVMLEKGTNEVTILANRVSDSSPLYPGTPLIYTNDLDITSDGTVYFTTSINVFPHRNAQHDAVLAHVPSNMGLGGFYDTIKGWGLGMCQALPKSLVMKYDPRTKEVHVVADGFWYGNGVALSADETFLAISETDRIRVVKLYIAGPKVRPGGGGGASLCHCVSSCLRLLSSCQQAQKQHVVIGCAVVSVHVGVMAAQVRLMYELAAC